MKTIEEELHTCELKGCLNAGLIKLWSFRICTMHAVGLDKWVNTECADHIDQARLEADLEGGINELNLIINGVHGDNFARLATLQQRLAQLQNRLTKGESDG